MCHEMCHVSGDEEYFLDEMPKAATFATKAAYSSHTTCKRISLYAEYMIAIEMFDSASIRTTEPSRRPTCDNLRRLPIYQPRRDERLDELIETAGFKPGESEATSTALAISFS
ncbi:hypothetical protein HELRODRAFT_183967 [Helobdella robusta]|uniref:Uncharacterized protein n=1 Tax=Helobdella robusta TaxID=6412 RepID=T1FKD4_HELRO|nr:hypothetical protein HELRODRAFT_183967 [Helobdella robusta]ESO09700.1 hypothetical protein HELRODRAFT_183967 [Helobdella robusta]